MTIDSPEFRAEVKEAMAAAFRDLRAAHPEERFYAYALYTDDGVAGISPAANGEEGFASKVEAYGKAEPGELAYLRWTPSEWAYEGFGWERTKATYHAIMAMEERADFETFREAVLTLMQGVLAALDAEGLFGQGAERERVTLLCAITDSDDSTAFERRTVHALNPPTVAARYDADWAV